MAAFRIDDRFAPAPEALFMDSPRSFFCGVLLRFAHDAFVHAGLQDSACAFYHLPKVYLRFVHLYDGLFLLTARAIPSLPVRTLVF